MLIARNDTLSTVVIMICKNHLCAQKPSTVCAHIDGFCTDNLRLADLYKIWQNCTNSTFFDVLCTQIIIQMIEHCRFCHSCIKTYYDHFCHIDGFFPRNPRYVQKLQTLYHFQHIGSYWSKITPHLDLHHQ